MVGLLCMVSCTPQISGQLPELFLMDAVYPPRFTVGGVVHGLVGNAPGITLQTSDSTVSIDGDGLSASNYPFSFPYQFRTDETYNVSVTTYPVSGSSPQLCNVYNGQGSVDNSNITDVVIDCVDGEWITVNVTGLLGDELRIQRTEAGGRTDIVSLAGGSTTQDFPTPSTLGVNNSFVILRQPQSPYQDCTLGSPGPGHITTQNVTCTTRSFDLNASFQGLTNPGLVLDVNGAMIPIDASTTFTVLGHLASGTAFGVSVDTQPTGQTCSILSGGGSIANSDHTVIVQCTGTGLVIGGDIAGLEGKELTLELTDSLDLLVESDLIIHSATGYAFSSTATNGESYTIKISSQPISPWQDCVFDATGTDSIAIGPVTANSLSNDITCTTRTYFVNVSVTGLSYASGSFTMTLNDSSPLTVSDNSVYTFPAVESLTNYAVKIDSFADGYYCELLGAPANGIFTGTITDSSTYVFMNLTNCAAVPSTPNTIYGPAILLEGCNVGGCPEIAGTFDSPPTLSVSTGSLATITISYSRLLSGPGPVSIVAILNDDSEANFFYDGSCAGNNDESCLDPEHWSEVVCDSSPERAFVGAPINLVSQSFSFRIPDDASLGPYSIRLLSGHYDCTDGTGFTAIDQFKAVPTSGIVIATVTGES